jgi:hypothetical protein
MRTLEFRLPHRGIGSATSTTFDFGANAPFTRVPAYCLPVYASQCPLPVHHARLGTWPLARLYQRSHLRLQNLMRFKAQPSSNRTSGSPRYGFPMTFPVSLSVTFVVEA